MSETIIIVLISLAAAALVIFLIWKNNKDKKLLNPDAGDAVEEAMGDYERRMDEV
ncbi:MAG: hypothetical protein ABIP30_01190 [Ferruginibacter sp.]